MIENAKPRTRFTVPEIRELCFLSGAMMYDTWVVFNVQRAPQDNGDLGQCDDTTHSPKYGGVLHAAAHPRRGPDSKVIAVTITRIARLRYL